MLLPLLLACNGPKPEDSDPGETSPPDDTGESATTAEAEVCAAAEKRLGFRACVDLIPDDDTFNGVTIVSTSVDQLRVGKYAAPARDDARLPTVFLDVNNYQLHYDFLVEAFPDQFAGLTTEEYESLILYPDTREMYAGTYSLYLDEDGVFYGFTVWDDPLDETSTVTMDEVAVAYEHVQADFAVGELYWVPNTSAQQDAALKWEDAPFPIRNPAEIDYEVYNPGEGYGYLRLYTSDEFVTATKGAVYGYQDILAIEEAPEDITRVVSGIVTGSRQGTLSHLNVRSSARGTPNCYIADPLTELAAWRDQLVHIECGKTELVVEAATVEAAMAWWEELRPEPVDVCSPDLSQEALQELHLPDTSTAEARSTLLCQYGAKGGNLSVLYQRIPEEYQLEGFIVPFHYYQQFIEENTWLVDLGGGLASHTFAETLDAWHVDATFLTDAAERQARLEALRSAMDQTPLDDTFLLAIIEEIRAVFGDDTTMVRFRSSSNAEDGLGFSGAGLYDSASACLADELDADASGPSLCDATVDNEKPLTDAIQEVWGSLWKMGAWDERDWYGIDQTDIAMGLLVDTRLNDEEANIVAFSGNPGSAGDNRYLINAQEGDVEVVSAEPGVYPEKVLLTVDSGTVTAIERVSASSEIDEVLDDAELTELGEVFYEVCQVFPQDDEVPEGHDILWDTEWKIAAGGQLIVKQIRPYLR